MGFGKALKKLVGGKPQEESSSPSPLGGPPGPFYPPYAIGLPPSYPVSCPQAPRPQPTREASKPSPAKTAAMAQIAAQTSQAVQALQDFSLQVLKVKCHKCSTPLLRNLSTKGYIKDWMSAATSKDGASICVVKCPSCSAETCVGCGETPVYSAPKSVREYNMCWCCTNGRLFGIWVLLSRYDDVELHLQGQTKEALEQQKKEDAQNLWRKQQMSSFGPTGFGFPGGFGTPPMGPALGTGTIRKPPVKGVGYDDDQGVFSHGPINLYYDGPGRPPGLLAQAVRFDQQDSKIDKLTCLILSLVTVLLPNGARRNLPPELKAMIKISLLLDKVAELLRNDSLDNVTKRYEVYSAALKFTARLACNPDLSCLVNEDRFTKRRTAGLQAVSEAAKDKRTTNDVLISGDEWLSSIGKGLENLAQQADIVLYARNSGAFKADGGQAMLDISDEIIGLQSQLATQPSVVGLKYKQPESVQERYAQYCKANCLTWDDSVFNLIHGNLRADAKRVMQSRPGRAKKLMTEMATMSTSLPPGIFVKVGESRTDVMKALIMGPKDSPYGYGMFEFDIFCTSEYPAVPPKVIARGGCGLTARVHLNPNIHADGKVCLSLLGTWNDGDEASKWQPNKSTILQVLITIQAMLFCEDPWRNEPGNGSATNAGALREARAYRMRRQPMTIKYGMLEWLYELRNGEVGIWDEIVENHFKINSKKILGNVGEWKNSNIEIEQWNGWVGSGSTQLQGFGRGRSMNLWAELLEQLRVLN